MKFNVLIIIYLVCQCAFIRGRKIKNLKKIISKINYIPKEADPIEDWISSDEPFLESSEEVEISEFVFQNPEHVKSLYKPVNWNAHYVPFKYPSSSYGSIDKSIASAYQVRPENVFNLISALEISKIRKYPENFKKLLKVLLKICQSESVDNNSKLSTMYTILKAFNHSPPSENLVDIILKIIKILSKHSNFNASYKFSKTSASVKDISNIILKIIELSKKNSDVTDPLGVIIPIIETLPNTYQEQIFKNLLTPDQRFTSEILPSPYLSSKNDYNLLPQLVLKLYHQKPKRFKTLSHIISLLADSDLVKYNENSNNVIQFVLRQLSLSGIDSLVYRLGHTTLSPTNVNFVITSFFKNVQKMLSDKKHFSKNKTLAKSKNKILTKSDNFQSEKDWSESAENRIGSGDHSIHKGTKEKSENLKILKKAKHKKTSTNSKNKKKLKKHGKPKKSQKDSAELHLSFYESPNKDTNKTLGKSENLKILKKDKHKKKYFIDNKKKKSPTEIENSISQKDTAESSYPIHNESAENTLKKPVKKDSTKAHSSSSSSDYKDTTNKMLKKGEHKKTLENTKNEKPWTTSDNSKSKKDLGKFIKPGFNDLHNYFNINERFYPFQIITGPQHHPGNYKPVSNNLWTNKQLDNNNMFLQILKAVSDTANNSNPPIFDKNPELGSDITGLAPYNVIPCCLPAPVVLPSSLDTINPFEMRKNNAGSRKARYRTKLV
ncbi:MATH and LRR domain-containing protein PFE0570w-like [Diabrotica virgifera virgifera]|uniref:MATH and LRR domain-containing protein PFE0570w-like n=1 Tax=Diabrotica virgifera virgifera TaxID=50390 RepID=A0A6P7GIL3_DIAVI|nr:MATH and LRR domain-containing protein PFE0570w-like [Diabrotica virgifera virgifera]